MPYFVHFSFSATVVKNGRLNTDISETEKRIKIYLRNAGDRVYGRKRPSAATNSVNDNEGSSSSSPTPTE